MEHPATIVFVSRASQRLRPFWLLLFSIFLFPLSLSFGQDVRADLPANSELRIENRRGKVDVEVWKEPHVSIVATFDGETPTSSPVIIRRTERLLNVMVASGATTATAAISVDLKLRVPERTRLEIITSRGEVEVRGLPAVLVTHSASGDIRFKFAPPADQFGISAKAPVGKITAVLPGSAAVNYKATLETGKPRGVKRVRLSTDRGKIEISGDVELASKRTEPSPTSTPETKPEPEPPTVKKPPELVGNVVGNNSAGTPATSSTEPQEIDEGDVVRVDTELVTLNVSVVDRATSRGLTGLTQADFKIFEDGIEQPIGHFEASNAPFNLVLLIDLSGSTKEKLNLIKIAAQHFVDAARPDDSIAVITFAGAPLLVSRLTSDRGLLRQRINSIETLPGDTKLYDSLKFAMTDALKDSTRKRRNAVVVMSDGLDGTLPSVHGDGSSLSYPELLSQVQEFDGVLYTLWIDTEYESLSDKDTQPEDFDAGHDRMAEMAEAGGGLFYEVGKLEDLAGAYERVVADIGTVYSLSYRPTNSLRDGKWRAIRVKLMRPNAVARGKSGYYAK